MKRIEFLWIVLVALFATTGCGGSSDEEPAPAPASAAFSVAGEWRLVSWSTLSTAEIYASFDKNGTFELYQRLYTPEFQYLHGTYTYADSALNGVYSDAVAWGSSYRVSFNADGSQMTLTAERDITDVSVFARATIPDEVRSAQSESSVQAQTKSGDVRLRFF